MGSQIFSIIDNDGSHMTDAIRAYGFGQLVEIVGSLGRGTYDVVEIHRLFGRDNETRMWGQVFVRADGRVELLPAN